MTSTPKTYQKVCKYCGSEFESTARNTRYCSKVCSDKAQEINIRKTKKRRTKRKEYSLNKKVNNTLSYAYKTAHKVAELFLIPKVCNCSAYNFDTPCTGDLELNHKDLNPFNNNPNNLEYLCKHHHARYHAEVVGDVNVVAEYQSLIESNIRELGLISKDDTYVKAELVAESMYRENTTKNLSDNMVQDFNDTLRDARILDTNDSE